MVVTSTPAARSAGNAAGGARKTYVFGWGDPRSVIAVSRLTMATSAAASTALIGPTALRLKGRLLFTPGVMVISVPYQLRSSQVAEERRRDEVRVHAGDLRRGRVHSRTDRQIDDL